MFQWLVQERLFQLMVHHVQQVAFLEVMHRVTHLTWLMQVMSGVISSDKPAEKGKIYLYISDLNPQEINITQPSFTATVHDINKFQTIQQVIEHGSHDYSPIQHKLFIFFSDNSIIKLHRSSILSFSM